HANHVRMSEACHRLRFAQQPPLRAAGTNELNRDVAPEIRIVSPINFAHRAAADELDDLVATHALADPLGADDVGDEVTTRITVIEVLAHDVRIGVERAAYPRVDSSIIEALQGVLS